MQRGASQSSSKKLWRYGANAGRLRVVRADAGFFDNELLTFLEERKLPYIVVARLTKSVQARGNADCPMERIRPGLCELGSVRSS